MNVKVISRKSIYFGSTGTLTSIEGDECVVETEGAVLMLNAQDIMADLKVVLTKLSGDGISYTAVEGDSLAVLMFTLTWQTIVWPGWASCTEKSTHEQVLKYFAFLTIRPRILLHTNSVEAQMAIGLAISQIRQYGIDVTLNVF